MPTQALPVAATPTISNTVKGAISPLKRTSECSPAAQKSRKKTASTQLTGHSLQQQKQDTEIRTSPVKHNEPDNTRTSKAYSAGTARNPSTAPIESASTHKVPSNTASELSTTKAVYNVPRTTNYSNSDTHTEFLSFLKANYKHEEAKPILAKEVYNYYTLAVPSPTINSLNEFSHSAGLTTKLKSIRMRTEPGEPRQRYYLLAPTSPAAKDYHKRQDVSFELLTGNIQGLISKSKGNKCNLLKGLVNSDKSKHHIIALTETWLIKNNHRDGEILTNLPNYRLFRADRNTRLDPQDPANLSSRGGCAIITSPEIIAEKKLEYSNGNCELLIVECTEIRYSIILAYRPPGINSHLHKFDEVSKIIDEYMAQNAGKLDPNRIILTGDFNFPERTVKWVTNDEGTVIPVREIGTNDEKKAYDKLASITDRYALEQLVNKNTRQLEILDLVFVSEPELYSPCRIISLAGVSDHDLIGFFIKGASSDDPPRNKTPNKPEISKMNFKRANLPEVKQNLLNTDWTHIIEDMSSYEQVNKKLAEAITRAAKQAGVPSYKESTSKWHWLEGEQSLLERKKVLECKLVKNDTTERDKARMLAEIDDTNTKILKLHTNEQVRQEKQVIEDIQLNPRSFYKYANKNKNTKTKIGPLKANDSEVHIKDPKQIAEILVNQYKSVFQTPVQNPTQVNFETRNCAPLCDITITRDEVAAASKEISLNSAPGPDAIPPVVYNRFAEELAEPIAKIWRLSLDNALLPEGKAQSIVTPIHKGGERCLPANYRPVALTNHLIKIFERIVRKKITEHMDTNNLFNQSQHGFRAGRSTVTQLLQFLDEIFFRLEMGNEVDIVYLDFAKAFDKVDHGILLYKLECMGIGGKLLRWIEIFLRRREMRVRVENELSSPVDVTSGVPQGSVLGPLLFLIMMTDIDKGISETLITSFADDTRLTKGIRDQSDQENYQAVLNTTFDWAANNNMVFNDGKFELLTIGRSLRDTNYLTTTGQKIEPKPVVKDLGIKISNDLHFKQHIQDTVAKGNRMAGYILRTFKTRKKDTMRRLLKTLIIPLIEYGSIIWSPGDQGQVEALESVQRNFTSKISCYMEFDHTLEMRVCTVDYETRLKDLNIFSEQRRLERYLILHIYKIIIKYLPNCGLQIANGRTGWHVTPKYADNRTVPSWVATAKGKSFFVRAPKLFNSLPVDLKREEIPVNPTKARVESWKCKLDSYLTTKRDNPDWGSRNSLISDWNIAGNNS